MTKPPHTSSAAQAPAPAAGLWTGRFLALNIITFLVFCNLALFFLLFDQLRALGLDSDQAGMVIGAFAVTGLILRPLISPLLTPDNARRCLAFGILGVAVSLAAYPLVSSFQAMLALRALHGAIYTLMAVASMAAFTGCIPPDRSGEAFGVLGVVTLLPYAVLPPLVGPLNAAIGNYFELVAWSAPAMLLGLPLLVFLRPGPTGQAGIGPGRPGRAEILANLADPAIIGLLVLFLLLTTCFAAQFYFIAPQAHARGIAHPGWFFTISTGSEIAVRLAGGRMLDRLSKQRLLAGAALLIAGCFAGLAVCGQTWIFLTVALVIGLGWGVCLPLFSALLFELSAPRLRALNSNLGMEAFQGGFLLGPLAGGLILNHVGFDYIFWLCAGVCLAVAAGGLFLRLPPAVHRPA